MSLSGYFRRRGFGVHSPLAYSIITDTLREGAERYYAYDHIERLPGSSQIKAIFRIVCRLAPKTASIRGLNQRNWLKLLQLADDSITLDDRQPEIVLTTPEFFDADEVGCPIVVVGDVRRKIKPREGVMAFTTPRLTLVLPAGPGGVYWL